MYHSRKSVLSISSTEYCAIICAEWGDTPPALDWLETAMRRHNAYLTYLKTRFDSLSLEPLFQAIEQTLKFPY